MRTQRERRYDVLKEESYWKRNWYVFGIGIPAIAIGVYKCFNNRKFVYESVVKGIGKAVIFYNEHVKEPAEYIIDEFFTSKVRSKITDVEALEDTRDSLKRMLYSWFSETYPDMKEEERLRRSNSMDVSLIEEMFEGNVSTKAVQSLLTGDIVRIALIQMQFLKKEMLTAMDAMDGIMESNEINFRLSSMMPALMVVYVMRQIAKYAYYTIMPTGRKRKSKEETFANLRSLLLDVERLLVMRDDPPNPPDQLTFNNDPNLGLSFDDAAAANAAVNAKDRIRSNSIVIEGSNHIVNNRKTLDENDWGMIMLLIHQIQTLLSINQNRFGSADIANFLEDLSEIAGERGPVSIKQQRAIVERMVRTYSFLKVLAGATLSKG
jgi:hypothetical protein